MGNQLAFQKIKHADGHSPIADDQDATLVTARFVATSNLSLTGAATPDGGSPSNGDVILAVGQTTNTQNGPYIYNSAGAWTRDPRFNASINFANPFRIHVLEGTSSSGSIWTYVGGVTTLGTDAVSFKAPPSGGVTPTGTGFRHVTTGTEDGASRAVNLATADVTGTLPAGNQAAQTMAGDTTGTTAASVVSKINGATVPAAGALTTGTVLRVTGASSTGYGALDLANGSAVTGQLPASNITTALASPPAIGGTAAAAVKATTLTATTSLQGAGTTDEFNGSGSTLTILDTEVVTGSGTKSIVRNGSRPAAATLSDNSTWVELATIAASILANNTGHDFLLKLLAVDYSTATNTQVSGDICTLTVEMLITVSNSGTITVSSGTSNSTTTQTLAALPGSVFSTVGGATGTTNLFNGLRARVSSGTVVLEGQGTTSKSLRIAVIPQSITRIF